jgi:hypothetical protein
MLRLMKLTYLASFCCIFGILAGPADALAQAAGDQCTLGKPAKLFKRAKGKAFRFKVKSGAVATLLEQVGARWKVRMPRGAKGFINVRHMDRVCTYNTPKSEKTEKEVPVEPPVPSPEPEQPPEEPAEAEPEKPVAPPVEAELTPAPEIEPPPVPLQPVVEELVEPEVKPAIKPVEAEKVESTQPEPESTEPVLDSEPEPELTTVVVDEELPAAWQLSDVPTLAYVSLGVGTAALGVAGYFGLEMQSNADLANAMDYGSHSAAQKAQDQAFIANIALGLGSAAIVTGLYLWLDSMFWPEDPAEKETDSDTPEVDAVGVVPVDEGVVVQVGGSF